MKQSRKRKFSPRGAKTYRALKLIGLLGFATVRQLCLTVWDNERTANDNVNRLLENQYLRQAHEGVDVSQGRGNRIVFLTRTGMRWVLEKGHLGEGDIAYYYRGEGDWHPSYTDHNVGVHDVLCAFIKQASHHPEKAIDIRLDPHAPLDGREQLHDFESPLEDKTLIPDRVFAVKFHKRVAEFYLEVDLGTEGRSQWRQKLEKYALCPEVMDNPSAFVLCVAGTRKRMETLLGWSKDLVDGRFRFSTLDEICYTYDRGNRKELVLTRKGTPFGHAWRVTSDDEVHPLVEGWSTG